MTGHYSEAQVASYHVYGPYFASPVAPAVYVSHPCPLGAVEYVKHNSKLIRLEAPAPNGVHDKNVLSETPSRAPAFSYST